MSDPIKITHGDNQGNRIVSSFILCCFGVISLWFFIGVMVYALFFQPPVTHSTAAFPNEIQQVFDELTALKTGLIKSNSALEERLVRLEENQKRQENNSVALSSFIEDMNKRVQGLEIFSSTPLLGEKNSKNIDWEILVKKHLATMPSTQVEEWGDTPVEAISESLRGIDRLLAVKGGNMDIVTGDDLGKFFKELPPALVLIYGDTLWPGQGQLTKGYVQNVWRTETIREIQRRAVLRALGKKTN